MLAADVRVFDAIIVRRLAHNVRQHHWLVHPFNHARMLVMLSCQWHLIVLLVMLSCHWHVISLALVLVFELLVVVVAKRIVEICRASHSLSLCHQSRTSFGGWIAASSVLLLKGVALLDKLTLLLLWCNDKAFVRVLLGATCAGYIAWESVLRAAAAFDDLISIVNVPGWRLARVHALTGLQKEIMVWAHLVIVVSQLGAFVTEVNFVLLVYQPLQRLFDLTLRCNREILDLLLLLRWWHPCIVVA